VIRAESCQHDIGFTFDRVFPSTTGQTEIFDFGVKGIVEGELSSGQMNGWTEHLYRSGWEQM
jgi:hypothetical protein